MQMPLMTIFLITLIILHVVLSLGTIFASVVPARLSRWKIHGGSPEMRVQTLAGAVQRQPDLS